MVTQYAKQFTDGIIRLWNSTAVRDGYKELSAERFQKIFLSNPYFRADHVFVLEDSGVRGFSCGCTGDDLPLGRNSAYITCIVLDDACQTAENFAALLRPMEESFKREGKKRAEVLFFNPILLPWYIPGTPKHEHNNAPGAPVGSFFYESLLASGYEERTRECAMYLNLNDFMLPGDIREKKKQVETQGYEVALFDAKRHTGVAQMLKKFDNPLWQREITAATQGGVPIVVAAFHGEVVGFAGPVIREESGRGYFSGIGVTPDHEGRGLGTILFFMLCRAFQEIHAGYMSLFTGIQNPAINIYRRAGFTPVREFAVMRKELV